MKDRFFRAPARNARKGVEPARLLTAPHRAGAQEFRGRIPASEAIVRWHGINRQIKESLTCG